MPRFEGAYLRTKKLPADIKMLLGNLKKVL